MENSTASKAGKFKILIILAIAATLSLGIYMYQGNEVSLIVDGEVNNLVSYSKTVEELIEIEEVDFQEGAYLNVPLDSKIEKNLNIIIKNPKNYTIEENGKSLEVTCVHDTVEEILKDQGIKLGKKDFTYPELSEKVSPNASIRLYRITEEIEVEESVVPFEEQVTTTNDLEIGETRIVQEGKDGVKKTHIKKEFLNGVQISEGIEKEEYITEPIPQIIEKGSRDFIVTSRGNTRYRNSIVMTATAYDLSFQSTGKRPGDRYYGITASGTKARPGVVAVDPRVIPLGTRLYVQSLDGTKDYGFAIAEDKGGAIKGNKIDLFFETANEVRRFGRRKVKVYILK